ncbi:MAG: molybdopterin-dependent oxidoreductase [Deltaproteobacteria bacterium]|nr:molybdopterin-dependent oxidoreductase [Deltaproteobacteria bacterium]
MRPSRRWFLRGIGAGAGSLAVGCPTTGSLTDDDDTANDDDSAANDDDATANDDDATGSDPFEGAEFLGLAELGPDATRPLDETINQGLDGRRYVDLADLDQDTLVLSNEDFYIRTREPDLIDLTDWGVTIEGLVDSDVEVDLATLQGMATDQGVHLMECSGNGGGGRFGLLSAAQWSGVPVTDVLDLASPTGAATRILIEGFDGHSEGSTFSTPGAAWVYTREQLAAAGAFFAITMNGEPLPADHGYPVRLLVPGWYGCCCIKWVNRIAFVDDNEPATSQMQEFAQRTHQTQAHALASAYSPGDIHIAAMPIRVEKYRVTDGSILYKVVGLMWGGTQTTDALTLDWGEGPVPVDTYEHAQNLTWTLWEHAWAPPSTGSFTLAMGVDDPSIPTRRLDSGWYLRDVAIDET